MLLSYRIRGKKFPKTDLTGICKYREMTAIISRIISSNRQLFRSIFSLLYTKKNLPHNSHYVVKLNENIKAQRLHIALNKTNEKVRNFIGQFVMLDFVNFYQKSVYYELFRLTNAFKSDIIYYV